MQPQLSEDTVEIGKKKKSTLKKVAIGAGIVAATALTVAAAAKVGRICKAKKDITKIYDGVFEEYAAKAKESGFEFVKPQLKFVAPSTKEAGRYISGVNIIEIPINRLDYNIYVSNHSREYAFNDGHYGVKQYALTSPCTLKQRIGQFFGGPKFPKATYDEFLLSKTSTLRHELTHARQDQILLNTAGGIEELYEGFKKKAPSLTEDEFYRMFPFYKAEVSKKIIKKLDTPIPSTCGNVTYVFTPKEIIDSLLNYTSGNANYYTNTLEVEARMNELRTVDTFKKLFPNTELDETFLEKFTKTKQRNLELIAEEMKKRQAVK